MYAKAFHNKTVWLSGHTGFKGAWLAQWLLKLGARVHGFALEPETHPALFEQLELSNKIHHQIADVRDPDAVHKSILATQPDFVFHLAAQSLVRFSYEQPVETYATNVMGTVHVLEALRGLKKKCAAVLVTTDKCYENREWLYGYREEDPLGGNDPYASSKAAAEIAIAAWRRSFFKGHPVKIASARAGNVIGGGDWAKDRIVPDCIHALQKRQAIAVRNPRSTRPWQHVLEPLSGYLWLAAMLSRSVDCSQLASAFNFGPANEGNRTVAELVDEVLKHWRGRWKNKPDSGAGHEAKLLQLSTDKAQALLGWSPAWNFRQAVQFTVEWYRRAEENPKPAVLQRLTVLQIENYCKSARQREIPWALS